MTQGNNWSVDAGKSPITDDVFRNFIEPDALEEAFKRLAGRFAVSRFRQESRGKGVLRDFEWNHMDQAHRPCVHGTYAESMRLAKDRSFAVSLTKINRFRLYVQVTDVRLGPGLFYQSYTLFGLIFVHVVIRMAQENEWVRTTDEWYVVSHPLLKFVHGFLGSTFIRKNTRVICEDDAVRDRRHELRLRGYRFDTDDPDYVRCNSRAMGTYPPPFKSAHRVSVAGLNAGETRRIRIEEREFFVERDETAGELLLWPEVCPHQGGPLSPTNRSAEGFRCPWHDFIIKPLRLSAGREIVIAGNTFRWEGENIHFASAAELVQS